MEFAYRSKTCFTFIYKFSSKKIFAIICILANLTFMGKNIPIYIQQDAKLHSSFYLETALHLSGGTSTHHQERKELYLQHLVFVTPLLLPAAIVEELELQSSSNSSTIATHSSNGVTNTRCCRYSCMRS